MEGALSLGRMSGNWGVLFAGPLSRHTCPESLNGDTLTVNVDSPAWLHQANFYKTKMLARLSSFGVRTIRFRQGPVKKPDISSRPEVKPVEITERARQEVEGMLVGIVDDELRDSIREAALLSISRVGTEFGTGGTGRR